MNNFFEDLSKQGVKETEMSFKELQQLFIDGKITEQQFTKILIDNLGSKKFIEMMQKVLEETYDKDLLTRPMPNLIHEPPGL